MRRTHRNKRVKERELKKSEGQKRGRKDAVVEVLLLGEKLLKGGDQGES